MKVTSYKTYAEIFDFFSNENIFPQNIEFIGEVSNFLFPKDKVIDVGGGTGKFTAKLLELNKGINLTFVEPSLDMMKIAKKRLPKGTYFIELRFQDIIDEIDKQDMFIFQRSLYSFFDSIDKYIQLVKKIYDKTNNDGHVAVFEINSRYDIPMVKEYYLNNLDILGISKEEFEKKWNIFKKILDEYNTNVDKGAFTLFSDEKVLNVFLTAGFKLVFSKDSMYFFKK